MTFCKRMALIKHYEKASYTITQGQRTFASCTMLRRFPNKELKSYIGKTKTDKGLKLSDNVKSVIFWAINLKLEILIYVGGKMAPVILRAITAKFWTKSTVFME